MGRLFGTDGIRGVANAELDPELAFAVGRAGAAVIGHSCEPGRPIVVGRDTRLSGSMLEAALVAGITSVGRDALLVGVVPTPGVAQITRLIEAAAGVVISASHNPIEDNGIKIFGPDGFKLDDQDENAIEAALDDPALPKPTGEAIGVARSAHGLVDRYFATLVESDADLSGLRIVVDAANGAAYEVGPRALRRLGADVVAINAEADGRRINVECGATDLRALAHAVRESREHGKPAIGVAFDGDADRALFVDEQGQTVNGDHVMLILARELQRQGRLSGDAVVGTVMSNVGLERALRASGIALLRAAVGDRYVLQMMREGGYAFGGEQSGHVIDLLHNTTGDGPMTAVALLAVVARERTTLHELASSLTVYPQVLVNVRTANKGVLESSREVRSAIAAAERALEERGRLLVRNSGTEPLIRVMIEGDDDAFIRRLAGDLAAVIERAAQA